MAGKIAPYIVIGYVQVTLILLLGYFLFGVPIRGSLIDLALGAGVFIAASLTLGLFISTLAATQFQAFQMTFATFVRIVRGIVLRGASLGQVWSDVWPLLLFFAVAMTLAMARFRKRLD